MSSILKRGLVVAAIIGVGVVPSSAMADHKDDHPIPPGQACKEMPPGERGECARLAAEANRDARTDDEPE